MPPHLPLRPLLEIEQKFSFNPALLPLFRANRGVPAFRSLIQPKPVATSSFRDIYYDKGGRLEKEGIWLRRREGKGWEVKQRVGGQAGASASAPSLLLNPDSITDEGRGTNAATDGNSQNHTYLRSTFLEVNSLADIHRLVRTHFGHNAPGPEDCFGLEVLCDFRTDREHATVDDDFDVVLDRTCFGHAVGEVELIAGRAGRGISNGNSEEGHRRIDAFMKKYTWFFGGKEIKGKLSAYFERFGEKEREYGGKRK